MKDGETEDYKDSIATLKTAGVEVGEEGDSSLPVARLMTMIPEMMHMCK
jgi:hypothetical protein